jgi:hypothetical protein
LGRDNGTLIDVTFKNVPLADVTCMALQKTTPGCFAEAQKMLYFIAHICTNNNLNPTALCH